MYSKNQNIHIHHGLAPFTFSFNAVRMLVCLGAVVSAGLASAKRAAGNKPYTGIGTLYRREVRRV